MPGSVSEWCCKTTFCVFNKCKSVFWNCLCLRPHLTLSAFSVKGADSYKCTNGPKLPIMQKLSVIFKSTFYSGSKQIGCRPISRSFAEDIFSYNQKTSLYPFWVHVEEWLFVVLAIKLLAMHKEYSLLCYYLCYTQHYSHRCKLQWQWLSHSGTEKLGKQPYYCSAVVPPPYYKHAHCLLIIVNVTCLSATMFTFTYYHDWPDLGILNYFMQ